MPRIDTLVKLAAALEVQPADLLNGMVWKPGTRTKGQFIDTTVTGLGLVTRRFEVEHHGDGGS